ncbi:hypothetical protein Plhal304r1_c017g0060561 [Plasmopara halstedii]
MSILIPDSFRLRETLSGLSINTARALTRVVEILLPRKSAPYHYGTFIIYPCLPEGMLAALHIWTFDGQNIIDTTSTLIRRLLKIYPPINHWSTLRKLQCDILPVFSDLLFRLKHNGLDFRYKFSWHTQDINCVHGCSTLETPKYLLQECYTANTIWRLFLLPFQWIFDTTNQWDHALFLINLTANMTMAIYDSPYLHFMAIFRQCLTILRLHLQRTIKALTHSRILNSHRYKFLLNFFKHAWNHHVIEDPFN